MLWFVLSVQCCKLNYRTFILITGVWRLCRLFIRRWNSWHVMYEKITSVQWIIPTYELMVTTTRSVHLLEFRYVVEKGFVVPSNGQNREKCFCVSLKVFCVSANSMECVSVLAFIIVVSLKNTQVRSVVDLSWMDLLLLLRKNKNVWNSSVEWDLMPRLLSKYTHVKPGQLLHVLSWPECFLWCLRVGRNNDGICLNTVLKTCPQSHLCLWCDWFVRLREAWGRNYRNSVWNNCSTWLNFWRFAPLVSVFVNF